MQRSRSMGSHSPIRSSFLDARAVARACLLAAALTLPTTGALAQMTYTVTSLDDTDSDDVGTFRWAVEQANNSAGLDTIEFDASLIASADSDFVIELELNSALQTITDEVEIVGPTADDMDPNSQEYFIQIVRDPSESDEIIVNETIIFRNAIIRSNALVIVGGSDSDPVGNIDAVFDIGDFVFDFHWPLSEHQSGVGLVVDEPGRVVKTGHGELALFPSQGGFGDYSGGALLVDGVLRTDTRGLTGDVQLCTSTAGNGYAASADCDAALLVFEMPGVLQDDTIDRNNPPTDGTFAGDISGSVVGAGAASVVKTGAGTLTLTGNNTYAGDTYVMEGELRGDLDAIPSSQIHICPGVAPISKPGYENPALTDPADIECDSVNDAVLTLDIEDDDELAAALVGDGVVNKEGNGELTIGTMASQAGFGGTLIVRDGQLTLDTALGTAGVDVQVRSGGTMSGTGTVEGDVEVRTGGRLLGALTIDGDLDLDGRLDLTDQDLTVESQTTIDNGAQIDVDATLGAAGIGLLVANGDLVLGDGAVAPDLGVVDVAAPPVGSFLIAEVPAAGTLSGTLTGGENGNGIAFENAIFDLDLTYGTGTACTTTNPTDAAVCLGISFDPVLSDDAETSNQRAIAAALDQAYTCAQDPTSAACQISQETADDFNELYGNFAVPARDIPAILDELTGDEYAAFADVRASAVGRFNRTVSRRFDLELLDVEANGDGGESDDVALPAVSTGGMRWLALGGGTRTFDDRRSLRMPWRRKTPREPMPIDRHVGAGGFTGWLDMQGVFGELDGGKNADDIDYRIYGPVFGIDYGLTENLVLGLSLGYTRNEIETPGDRARGTGDSYQGGLYFGALFEDFYIAAAARYAYTDFETRRRIRFGDLRRTARADFDARDISGFFEAAYRLPFPEFMKVPSNLAIQPYVSVAYSSLDQGDFRENDAGSLNLHVDSQIYDALQSGVGVRIAFFGRDAENRYMLPQLRLAYEREWLDPERPLDANLPAAGSSGDFEVEGVELPRDRAVIGVTSEVGVTSRVNLFVDYDLRVAEDLLEHSLALGLRALF